MENDGRGRVLYQSVPLPECPEAKRIYDIIIKIGERRVISMRITTCTLYCAQSTTTCEQGDEL